MTARSIAQKHATACAEHIIEAIHAHELVTHIRDHIEQALEECPGCEGLLDKVKQLEQALKHYARRYEQGLCWNWNERIPDSYSGVVHEFDWNGEEQDEPWEIAEKALNERAEP